MKPLKWLVKYGEIDYDLDTPAIKIPSFSRDRPVPSYAELSGTAATFSTCRCGEITEELKVRRPKCADLLWVHSEFLKHRHMSHGKLSLC